MSGWLRDARLSDGARIRSIVGDFRDELWRHAIEDPPAVADTSLANSLTWLERQFESLTAEPADADAVALGAFALHQWDPRWLASERGQRTARVLKETIGDEAASFPWAASIVVRLLLNQDHVYALATAERLAAIPSTDLDAATLSQRAVALRAAGIGSADVPGGDELEGEGLFTVAQAVWAAGECGNSDGAEVRRWSSFVADALNRQATDRQNCAVRSACLQALAVRDEGNMPQEVAVQADRLLAERRADGSWYGQLWETAWALAAMNAVQGLRYVRLSTAEVTTLVGQLADRLERLDEEVVPRDYVKRVAELAAAVLLISLVVVAFLAMTIFVSLTFALTALGAVGAAVAAIVVFSARRFRDVMSRSSHKPR